MTEPVRPKVREDLSFTEIGGEAVVYDPAASLVHLLNPQAAIAFQCFDGSGTIAEVAADIADAFGMDPTEIQGQVSAVYDQFRGEGMIEGVERLDALAAYRAAAGGAAAQPPPVTLPEDTAADDLDDEEDDEDDEEPG